MNSHLNEINYERKGASLLTDHIDTRFLLHVDT